MERRTYHAAVGAISLVGALAVWTTATQVFPHHSLNHDEAVYLQQAAMLLEGQLNLWPPVEGAVRPWFFVADGGRLYSKYSPVPAAMFAVGRVLGGYRLALVGIAAANLALVVGVVREVFDRETGLVAGGFVLASPLFLLDSSVFLPYAPTTLLNLLFAYGYLRADRTGHRRWAVLSGAGVGLAFFARPFTAVLFATPFVVHAAWSLVPPRRDTLVRQGIVAVLGTAGVGLALGYNAVMTGSPWRFPYQAFAPRDGLGFGHRELLAHEVHYTPELALRANAAVVDLFATEWIAGGVFGLLLVVVGVVHAARTRRSPRVVVLAGLFVSIVVGNVFFWGNLNILGDLDRAGDGLVAVLGPYYHFDLLLPTAAFAAVGARRGVRFVRHQCETHLDPRLARTALLVVLVVSVGLVGTTTASALDGRIDRNMEVTATYQDAYEPFEGGPPANSVVLLPDPYGDWLNHPFQPLRNDPGFDGRAVYAIDDHPFEVVDAFPDRRVYRYGYRGAWAPYDGSPDAARLQRVRDVSGSGVRLRSTVGIPEGAVGVTVRLATDDGSAYYVARNASGNLTIDLAVSGGGVRVDGDVRPVDGKTLQVDGRDVVRLTVFVDYGAGGGFSYRFDLPVVVSDAGTRALTPRVELCRRAGACGGAATYVPSAAPAGASVSTDLSRHEPNP